MPSRPLRPGIPRSALAVAALSALLILIGALVWLVPYLTNARGAISEVPDVTPLASITEFPVPAHQRACTESIGIDPNSRIAQFELRPAAPSKRGGPPVELLLRAPGYRAVVQVPGGYLGGGVALPVTPPKHAVIGSACFINRGHTTVLLDGTTEPRSVSRSATQIAGRPVVGDVALSFSDSVPHSLLSRLGEIFGHASNLTDRLLPAWLIWALAILVALGLPAASVLAFYLALRMDAGGEAGRAGG